MALINPEYKKRKRKPLKRSKVGFELEFHLIDNKGRIQNKAQEMIDAVKKANNKVPIGKEAGKNMIEIGCYPGVETFNPALDTINSVEIIHETAKKLGFLLYPFSTYPVDFNEKVTNSPVYKIKEKILGREKFKIANHCTAFQCHYTLPKGVFDTKTKNIRLMMNSKLSRTLISSYNFGVAIDPVLALFAQSSPFFRGVNLAKDSRIVVYRGGRKLRYDKGLYTKLQQFGALPPYKQTLTDLMDSQKRRVLRWKQLMKKVDPGADINKIYYSKLDIGWNALRLNKHGTLEQRSMDMNFLSIIFAIAILYKSCLKKIQREFIEVLPTDFGVSEAFKLENGILFIPPHSYVRNKLQLWSAYKGYGKKEMYNYARRFFNFAKSVTPKSYNKLIKPIGDMIENKESMSDKILKYARRKEYIANGRIGKKDAYELSLYYAEQFYKDLMKVEENLNLVKYSVI